MEARESKKRGVKRNGSRPETRLKGRAVSRGIGVGKVVWVHGNTLQFFRVDLPPEDVPNEIARLRKAVETARKQLRRLAAPEGERDGSGPGIFRAHLALIDDSSLISKFENEIESQRVNAEWAIKHVSDIYVSKYKTIDDETLRDRYIDFEDVAERILAAMEGNSAVSLPFAGDSVIAARELKPSTLIELARDSPRAIITENGGWTSHTFIIAREMKLPAVTGLKKLSRRLKTGDCVIVDGFNGKVILDPDGGTIDYHTTGGESTGPVKSGAAGAVGACKTLDGVGISIYANCDTPESYRNAAAEGALGIGLFRSEFLFDKNRGLPTEASQTRAFEAVSAAVGEGRVKIRTFDLGAERLIDQGLGREKNPALGLRAVRIGLAYPKIMRTQLRSILRASATRGNIDLVVPMVSGVSELRAVKIALEEEFQDLENNGKPARLPGVGVMVEIPSAVMMIDEIVAESDFVCLGTNDLIQYLLAADRDNESVAGWYRSLHPAVLQAIGRVISASRSAGKSAIVCGEMAGSPYYVPILVGLGATELSMNANSISRVRTMINGIAAEECRSLIKSFSEARTADEIEAIAGPQIEANWSHLFPQGFAFS